MDKDKQIEEMAELTEQHCRIDNMCGSCSWETCNECLSEVLYNAGYRKASDVAREVITEFANMLKCHSFYMSDEYGEVNELVVTVKAINEIEADLKKKYTEEVNDDE